MAAIETAYVHIGLHKTGTTSIQQTFSRHRGLLRETFGLIYPSVANNHSVPLYSMFCDDPSQYAWNKAAGITGIEALTAQHGDFAARLDADLRASGRTVVLSGEDLGLLSHRGVARFAAWLAGYAQVVRVLAYVREPVAWATSQAQQQVRQGRTLADLATLTLVPRFRRRLQPWMAAFGAEAVRVCDFDVACRHEGGLVGHFAAQVGLPPAIDPRVQPALKNRSFCAEAVALLSALNAAQPHWGKVQVAPERKRAVQAMLERIEGQRFALGPAAVARTQAAAAPELAWLEATFGLRLAPGATGDEVAPLFSGAATLESLARLLWEAGGAEREASGRRSGQPPTD